MAGLRPERVRRDESRLYVCGQARAEGVCAVKLTAPKGSNYSITAGKRSAPADRRYHYITALGGSNITRTLRTGARRMSLPRHRHR